MTTNGASTRALDVTIDADRCQGHARCWSLCPEVFDVDDRGYGSVRTDVDATQYEDNVRRAEQNCPELAITVTEVTIGDAAS
jgi:ferredoxin